MQTVSIENVQEKLRGLSPEKLNTVYDFVSLLEKSSSLKIDTVEGMLLSEPLLSRELGDSEEDAVWADL
jgi:hypothetical protein